MAELKLTEQEHRQLLEALNNNVEPPVGIAAKLFPSLHAKLDVRTLNNARIPTIEYAGKRPEAAILNEASAFGAGSPLQVVRVFQGGKLKKGNDQLDLFVREAGETYETGWKNLIVQGDNLQFLKTCYMDQDPIIKGKVKGKVKLIYIDPPFATKGDFGGSGGEDSYADRIDRGEFVEQLRERLIYMREVLRDDGSIVVHLDQKMSHCIKIVMDEIFGKERLLNEIIWHYENKLGTGGALLDRRHDTLLWYAKSKEHTFHAIHKAVKEQKLQPVTQKVDGERIWLRDADGKRLYRPSRETRPIGDVWSIPIINPVASERLGYPTQKPEELLEHVIFLASDPGDLVIDVFSGSGTTLAVAERLSRRWIGCDFGKHAVYTIQSRIASIAESQKLGFQAEEGRPKGPYEQPPKDFGVVSVGAFDFSRIMDLRKNKDAYIAFVLGIFGITERGEQFAKKYHISNVVAEKDGHPVEVYPVWDDKWLREVRIDEDYLKGIVRQANGKLKGTYYIITPQVCTRMNEVTMANGNGGKVTFKTLTFPYKILEDAARHFQLSEQPDSPENINRLISSVGFYFNEEVDVKVNKTPKGFKVTAFKTTITDTNEKAFDGLDGLAMILVDTEYDGETFKVDACMYQKDLQDGEVALKDAGKKTALIAVDKHGNESQIVMVK